MDKMSPFLLRMNLPQIFTEISMIFRRFESFRKILVRVILVILLLPWTTACDVIQFLTITFNVRTYTLYRLKRIRNWVSSPASRVQRLESSFQRPASNSCVQSPGIPVCHFSLRDHCFNFCSCNKFFLNNLLVNSIVWHLDEINKSKCFRNALT